MAKSNKKPRILKLDTTDNRRSAGQTSASSQTPPSEKSIGADLKAARLSKQITLQQVAQDTHISLRHFQNIEEGQFGELPGGMYNRAFLRRYAEYLGLEPEVYVKRYEKESAPQGEKIVKAKARSTDLPTQPLRVPAVLVWSVMLMASVAGLYFSRHWIAAVFSPYFAHPPVARLTETKPAPPAAASNIIPPTTAARPPSTLVTAEPAISQPAPGYPPGTLHLEMHAVDPCWISVSGDGKRQLEKLLQPGEDHSFDAMERFEIVFGNAGGVNLKINGKPARPLGKSGEVLKLLINAQNIADLLQKVSG